MQNTTGTNGSVALVASAPAVNGSLSTCQINVSNVRMNPFHIETLAVDSCTGVIVSRYTHTDMGAIVGYPILGLAAILLLVGIFVGGIITRVDV